MSSILPRCVKYDFSKHIVKLNQYPRVWSLSDLGIIRPEAPCQFGVSEPFKLFDRNTVEIIRSELENNDEIGKNCYYTSSQAKLVIRGAYKYSSFLNDLWSCSQLSNYVSRIIGTNVITHTLDDELGHVNVQFPQILRSGDDNHNQTKNNFVFNWHVDQDSPIVLIVMLSEIPSTGAVGGSTLYQDGFGNINHLTFKEIGYAYILHGTQIPHAAEIGANFKRLTGVCGFKIYDKNNDPNSTTMDYDATCLGNAIDFSSHPKLANNYFDYRLTDMINAMTKYQLKYCSSSGINTRYDTIHEFDYDSALESLKDLQKHLDHTIKSFERFTNEKYLQSHLSRPHPITKPNGIFDP